MDDDKAYERALARVRGLRDFYIHAVVYVVVIGGLFAIDWLTRPGLSWWFYIAAVGWGVGLAIHAFMVFGADRLLDAAWEPRKARELLERERHQRA